jgi:integrase
MADDVDDEQLAIDSFTNGQDTHRLITDQTADRLNPKQLTVYRQQLEDFEIWMSNAGKEPENRVGLSPTTIKNYIDRIDKLFRTAWDEGTLSLTLESEQLDYLCEGLVDDEITQDSGEPYGISSKHKFVNTLEKYAEYRERQHGQRNWKPPQTVSTNAHKQPDEFTQDERRMLREASLCIDSLPTYSDSSPSQRQHIKEYLSQSYGKPIDEITPEFWRAHNRSWEIPSLINTTLDAALRPCEVNSAVVDWPRIQKGSIYIPKEESAKNRENWEVALRSETVDMLDRWLAQREVLDKYQNTNHLWVTREGNPWSSGSLNGLLDRLCDEAGIDTTNRRIVWMSIRHSVGEHMTEEGNISQAKEQMRHKSIESTLKYTDPSLSNRRDTLDRMG